MPGRPSWTHLNQLLELLPKAAYYACETHSEDDLRKVSICVKQLWRFVTHGQTDPREDHQLQNCLRQCLQFLPQLKESSVVGPFTVLHLIEPVRQVLDEFKEALTKYNERALAFHIGKGHLFTGNGEDDTDPFKMY